MPTVNISHYYHSAAQFMVYNKTVQRINRGKSMKWTIALLMGCTTLGISTYSLCNPKIIACPTLGIQQYGKSIYYDSKTNRMWNLIWSKKQTPTWESVSIPKVTTCGTGKTSNGIPLTYQCAIFQCKSDAVTATLGQNQALKCFSTYVSNRNTFYCDSFS